VIAGRGDSHYADRVKEEASRLSNVTYLGEIDNKEKILLIRSSYVNILLSSLEALGLAQLEFMYFGIPVVTSGVGGQSWLVKNGREGIQTSGPEDAEGAAKAVQGLVDDHELWSKLSANAKQRASELTSSRIMQELDEAITNEMVKESGLNHIPREALVTLAEPEKVLRTWSAGSWGVVATDRRLFVRHGRVSRKVTEIPYASISYIEHTRRFPWKILIAGLIPALIVLLEPLWRTILKTSFISGIEQLLNNLIATVPWLASPQTLAVLIGIVPYAISLVAFLLEARVGFNLYIQGMKPIYFPHGLKEVMTFIRKIQDKQQNAPRAHEN